MSLNLVKLLLYSLIIIDLEIWYLTATEKQNMILANYEKNKLYQYQ
jgi:hypothetical protein